MSNLPQTFLENLKIFSEKTFVIILGIIFGYILYTILLKNPFEKYCFTNTNSCLSLKYWKKDNSLFGNVIGSNYNFWFNGKNVYVFGQNTGNTCVLEDYESVYVIDVVNKKILGYECIVNLETIQNFYLNQNIQEETIYMKSQNDIFNVMNNLNKQNIISF